MKAVEELGISPMPWKVENEEYPAEYGGGIVRCFVRGSNDSIVNIDTNQRDARLISAAPELYDCLRSATIAECRGCKHKSDCHDYIIPCPIRRWRRALAKASGEEVE